MDTMLGSEKQVRQGAQVTPSWGACVLLAVGKQPLNRNDCALPAFLECFRALIPRTTNDKRVSLFIPAWCSLFMIGLIFIFVGRLSRVGSFLYSLLRVVLLELISAVMQT